MGSPGGSEVKNLPAVQETQVRSLGQQDLLEEGMTTPALLPGEAQGQRSLAGCSPRGGCTESDMTEATKQQQQTQCSKFLCYR